jgi:uncharacterized protein
MDITPYIRILIAICLYFAFAVSASLIAQKTGINLKDMKGRTSPQLLLIGAAANLGALIAILLLLIFVDGKTVSALGVAIRPKDYVFSILAFITTFLLAVVYISFLKRRQLFQISVHKPTQGIGGAFNLIAGLFVLFLVAIQEEMLYRGYVFLNLAKFNPLVILAASTLIFTLIHFLTNRVNLHQILSWLLSGLILGGVYLVSGSIWVPIVVHFAIDATNVLIFNITGQYSLFTISPQLTERDRTVYRLVYEIAMIVFLLAVYGPVFSLS